MHLQISVSETIESLGDMNNNIADEQLFGDVDYIPKEFKQEYHPDLPKEYSKEYTTEVSGDSFKFKDENTDLNDMDLGTFDEFEQPFAFNQEYISNKSFYQPNKNAARGRSQANMGANPLNHHHNMNVAQNGFMLDSHPTNAMAPNGFTNASNMNSGPHSSSTSSSGSNEGTASGTSHGGMTPVMHRGSARKPPTGPSSFEEPFRIDLEMVRRTMKGVNAALNVDLGGAEVGESVLDDPLAGDFGDSEQRDGSTTKAEMSHVRLISDACGHIVVSVGRAVLHAAREAAKENALAGVRGQRPKPPIRKKRGGILGFKELAQRANLSPWHFHRVFRFVTGVTPKAYGETLWEFLMAEAGFDLDNEELTINLPKARSSEQQQHLHPQQSQAATSDITSQGSSPSSPPSAGEPYSARTGLGVHSTAPSLTSGSSQASIDGHSEGNSPTHTFRQKASTPVAAGQGAELRSPLQAPQQSQPLAPLSGPVPPGRIRKSSSSRGARSRSRTRSQPSGVLSGLNSEPDSAGAQIRRGRSSTRLAPHPALVTTERALQGSFSGGAIGSMMGLPHGPPSNMSPMGSNMPNIGSNMGSSMPNVGSNIGSNVGSNVGSNLDSNMRSIMRSNMAPRIPGLTMGLASDQLSNSSQFFDVPDLNNLSLQPETESRQMSSMSPMTQEFMAHMHRPSQFSSHAQLESRDSLQTKGHHRGYSTGALPNSFHPYNNYFVPAQALSMGLDDNSRGRMVNSSLHSSNAPRLLDHPGVLLHSNSNPDSGRTSPRLDTQGHNFQDDLQRELMLHERQGEDAKHDQLSDLPASFYLSMNDKSAFETSLLGEDFSSALIGADDPPLVSGWNDAADNFLS